MADSLAAMADSLAAMAALPSYREATSRPDWLALAAPHVRFADYPALCRVSRRAWSLFGPRLWSDLLAAACRSGLDPGDDLDWWLDFVFHKLSHVAPATRALVRVLDARRFAPDAYPFALGSLERPLEQSFVRALELLPNTACVLFDGHAHVDRAFLFASPPTGPLRPRPRPRLLSIANCPNRLPESFAMSPQLQDLVYLDVSACPGPILPLFMNPPLSHLRILKVRAREIDDRALMDCASRFRNQLWSLDLSDNNITDAVIQSLRDRCIAPTTLRSDAHFRVEGRVVTLHHGTREHGPFYSVQESDRSSTFSHPERYFVDAPTYGADDGPELRVLRADGGSPIRRDSADESIRVLSKPETDPEAESFCGSRGITHLRLSRTRVSSFGIQWLLRVSSGHLEDLECDRMPLLPRHSPAYKVLPTLAGLYGIVGAAHLFRPVFSSNLRVLRIHHSLVTHVLTLEVDGLSAMARLYLAETAILERVDKAYAQAFVPDMNPRLTCLTLTCIPRRSSGPLVARLVRFIQLLSLQERAIQETAAMASPPPSSWRSPRLLQGLRHLTLEFEPDPMDDASGDLDAEELMTSGEPAFTFFQGERAQRRQPATVAFMPPAMAEPTHSIADRASTTWVDWWNGEGYSPVWIGPRPPASNDVLVQYRRLVVDHRLRHGVGPATPAQVLAGAPDGSYLYHTAWCAAVMPPELQPPGPDDLAGMKDVLGELRAFRLAAKAKYAELERQAGHGASRVPLGAPHFFWTGNLKVLSTHARP